MLEGLRDTSWPARFALFAALVGHAFAPRPLEGQPRSLAADRGQAPRALRPAALPPPVDVRPAGTPVAGAAAPRRGAVRDARPSAWTEPARFEPLSWRSPEVAGERFPLPAFAWRLEGRTFLGLELGRVRTLREDASSRDEVPRGFGVRAVLSF